VIDALKLLDVSCASLGATHHLGCPCHEAAWAEKLAAAEGWAAEAERLLLVHTSGSVKYQAAAMAAEERARKLEEAIVDYLEWGAMTGSDRDLFADRFRVLTGRVHGYYCDGCQRVVPTSKHEGCRYYTTKLAPPPEAEKKGGE
jgi:hypothetical protein